MSSSGTQKILICGDIAGNFDLLTSRIDALQNSAAGPFHILFIVGTLFRNEDEYNTQINQNKLKFLIPTYIYDVTGIPQNILDNIGNTNPLSPINLNILQMNLSNTVSIGGIGIATINNLTVAYCIDKLDIVHNANHKQSYDYIMNHIVNAKGYRGCDLFLSNEWPMDCHQFLETELLISSGISFGLSSKFIANVAMSFLPRYHFAIGKNIYFQRPPYTNHHHTSPTGASPPCTRFIGLGQVSENKDKEKKYLHALSLLPIIHMNVADLADIPIGSTDCPYVPISTLSKNNTTTRGVKHPLSLTSPADNNSNKRVKVDPVESNRGRFDSIETSPVPTQSNNSGSSGSGSFFFGSMGASRPPPPAGPAPSGGQSSSFFGLLPTSSASANSQLQTTAPNQTVRTLFISGVGAQHRHISDTHILSELPGSTRVYRPEGKSFMFVEFPTHGEAKRIIDTCSQNNNTMLLCDKQVTVGE